MQKNPIATNVLEIIAVTANCAAINIVHLLCVGNNNVGMYSLSLKHAFGIASTLNPFQPQLQDKVDRTRKKFVYTLLNRFRLILYHNYRSIFVNPLTSMMTDGSVHYNAEFNDLKPTLISDSTIVVWKLGVARPPQ